MRTAISSAESRALPAGLRIRRQRRPPIWYGFAALAGGGLVLGTVLAGAPPSAILGTVAVLLAAGAAIYWPALGLAILAFTYPFDLTTYAGPVKVTSSAALMAVLALVLVGRQFLRNPPPIQRTKLDIPVALFAAASVLSLASMTGNLSGQLVGLVKAFGGFVLFFIATQTIRELRDALVVVGAIIATGFVQALDTVIPFINGSQAVSVDSRATGTLVDANLFAGYLVLIIPLVLAMGTLFRPKWATLPMVVVTVAMAGALVVTLSRSGWLGLAVGLVSLWFLLRERRWRIAGLAVVVVAFLAVIGLSGPIAARLGPAPDNGPAQMLASREEVWGVAARITLDHPIFGVGIDSFQDFYPIYSTTGDDLNHAHNLFLNIAAERGFLGLLAFGVLILTLFKSFARASRKAGFVIERALVAGLLASFVAYCAHSLFDVSYYDYKVLLLFWLLVGVTASLPSLLGSLTPLGLGWRSSHLAVD